MPHSHALLSSSFQFIFQLNRLHPRASKVNLNIFIYCPTLCIFRRNARAHMGAQRQQLKASSHIRFLSAGTALLDKHRLTAQVVNAKPAGCDSGELEALWLSDFSSPFVPCCFLTAAEMECGAGRGVKKRITNNGKYLMKKKLLLNKPKRWMCVHPFGR